jgi:cell division protein FtsB
MKLARLLVYLSLGFVVRSLYLFFFGGGGLADYRVLESYKRQLEENIGNLQAVNAELLDEQRALGTDPERVALQARELGYFREDERVVRLEGYAPAKRYFSVGSLVRARSMPERRDWIAKMLGLTVPLALFVAALARDRRRKRAPQRR